MKIIEAKVSDSGNYNCMYLNQEEIVPAEEQFVQLTVGAFAKPSVRTIKETGEGTLLSCEVTGASPEPSVVWYDSAGRNVSVKSPEVKKQGVYHDILLKTTVISTGYYTCIVTQKELHHQMNETTFVRVQGDQRNTGFKVELGVGLGGLGLLLFMFFLACFVC
ncbi:butyrophilin-like protein 2 [Anableps anableps]